MSMVHSLSSGTSERTSRKNKPKPPCAAHPHDWDLDVGTPEAWHRAVGVCHSCPLFDHCREMAATLSSAGHPPRSMIWAGIGYDSSGNVIEDLERHRTGPVEHRRPLVIIHRGHDCPPAGAPTPNRWQDDGDQAPRRTIILQRRGRSARAAREQ